jgi:glutamate/aspartate transport system ATP-binding protein
MSAIENVKLGQLKVLGRNPAEADEKATALLKRVGLAEHAQKYPS